MEDPADTMEKSLSTPSSGVGSHDALLDSAEISQPSQLASTTSGSTLASASASTGGDAKVLEKTISCVSCRRRKLRCDRAKPSCGTCDRLRHECEYPERRRNLGSKRRNMKELEARLAQVETKLVSEVIAQRNAQTSSSSNIEPTWSNLTEGVDLNIGEAPLDSCFDIEPQMGFSFQSMPPVIPVQDPRPQELISLGLDEPLPPQQMIDDLYEIFFDKFQINLPMIHKYRYCASMDLAPHMRPPVCLRYAIWAIAANLSDDYLSYEDVLYQRARKYAEAEEMKGYGESFVTLYHTQTWVLIANFEAKKTLFSRAWMSTGRNIRLAHMLGLHRLDGDSSDLKQILPPPRDWIELEERRRTFWAGYYNDRWSSAGTGWPMLIDEQEILTNLPASEISFEQGTEEDTTSLADALTPYGNKCISPFGGVIMSATLFGHNSIHLHRTTPDDCPEDISNGDFWKRHRKIDNVLSNTFMFLPDNLRMPAGVADMNVVFLHMNIHASTICLHQAAILAAQRHDIDASVIRQSQGRCLLASQEIANIMRLISHVDPSRMSTWMGFCLYVAAGVSLQNAVGEDRHPQSIANLEFILAAMNAIGLKHSITKHFVAQLELDIEANGLGKVPSSMVGQLTGCSFALDDIETSRAQQGNQEQNCFSFKKSSMNPLGYRPRGPSNTSQKKHVLKETKTQQFWGPGQISHHVTLDTDDLGRRDHIIPPYAPNNLDNNGIPNSSPLANTSTESSMTPENLPQADFSLIGIEFPFRQAEPHEQDARIPPGSWTPDIRMFTTTSSQWRYPQAKSTSPQNNDFEFNTQSLTELNDYLDDVNWNEESHL